VEEEESEPLPLIKRVEEVQKVISQAPAMVTEKQEVKEESQEE
jgi:hypothetical protein